MRYKTLTIKELSAGTLLTDSGMSSILKVVKWSPAFVCFIFLLPPVYLAHGSPICHSPPSFARLSAESRAYCPYIQQIPHITMNHFTLFAINALLVGAIYSTLYTSVHQRLLPLLRKARRSKVSRPQQTTQAVITTTFLVHQAGVPVVIRRTSNGAVRKVLPIKSKVIGPHAKSL